MNGDDRPVGLPLPAPPPEVTEVDMRERRSAGSYSAWSVSLLGLLVAFSLVTFATPAHTAEPSASVGLRAGMNWSRLIQPDDKRHRITLMHGTAFDGFGFSIGPSFTTVVQRVGNAGLGLELDLLYSRHMASGFERAPSSDAERTAVLTAHVLRIPLLFRLNVGPAASASGPYLGLGPEVWAGLRSGATVTVENTDAEAPALQTTPVTHATFNAALGFDIDAGPRATIPIELRGTWDPFVGRTTVDRFQGYDTASNPGSYEVAFNWQLMLMTGFSWDVL